MVAIHTLLHFCRFLDWLAVWRYVLQQVPVKYIVHNSNKIYLPTFHIGLCVVALILAALAITTIVYGQCSADCIGKGRQRTEIDDPYLR